VLIKFGVRGVLRFVSHAEMLKLFQRACARAGIEIQHSQGFNPHPKLSLPLPRPVGIESDDELLSLWVHKNIRAKEHKDINAQTAYDLCTYDLCSLIKDRLSEQLPEGCELLSVSFAQTNKAVQPSSATYIILVQREYLNDKLWARIEGLLESHSLIIERSMDTKASRLRTQDSRLKRINVRPFIKSIETNDSGVVIDCIISPAGSIRVEEILKLLEIDVEKLAGPIKRTNVRWQAA
jgi:uncharacterized protein (DUF2344 family)